MLRAHVKRVLPAVSRVIQMVRAQARCHSQGLPLASFTYIFGPEQLRNASPDNSSKWCVNAHSIWHNSSGPALEDGTLLTAVDRGTFVSNSNGSCYMFSEHEFSSVECRLQVWNVQFGCRLQAGIEYTPNGTSISCPSEWQTPEFQGFRIPFWILEIALTNFDAGRLHSTRWQSFRSSQQSRGAVVRAARQWVSSWAMGNRRFPKLPWVSILYGWLVLEQWKTQPEFNPALENRYTVFWKIWS